jgi:hypothetical protein
LYYKREEVGEVAWRARWVTGGLCEEKGVFEGSGESIEK